MSKNSYKVFALERTDVLMIRHIASMLIASGQFLLSVPGIKEVEPRKEVTMAKKKATKPAPAPFAPKAKKGGKPMKGKKGC